MTATRPKAAPQSARASEIRGRCSPDAPKADLVEQSTLVDLLQESRAQRVGHLENSSQQPLGQGVEVSAFIGVDQRPILITVPFFTKTLQKIIGRR
jgi:hypothetical protein